MLWRHFSTPPELTMSNTLREALGASTHVEVEDISGGCGSMYKIEVESPAFKGKSMVNQHKMVTAALKVEIGGMHGLTITTRKPTE